MKKALKIFLYILGGIFGLVIIAIIFLLTPPGKELVRSKAESFLQNKLKTTVRIGQIDYSIPKWLELKDVLFLDQQKDTLISAGTLRVDIAMLKLINGTVQVNKLKFENGIAHIYRTAPDTTFNFDYIVKAFSSPTAEPKPEQEKPADTSGGLVLDIRELALKNIRFNFDDYTGGSRFGVAVNELEAKINKTDINKMDFDIKRLYINGLHSTFALDTSYLPEEPEDTTTSSLPMLAADELDLNDVSFEFNKHLDRMLFSIGLKQLLAHPKVIDLNTQYVTLNDLLLDTTNIKMVMGKKEVTADKAEEAVDSAVAQKWKVLANSIKLNGINFKMDDENAPRQQYGIDYAHLDVRNLTMDLEQLLYTTDTIAGNLKHLAVQEKSGFDLKEFKTQFAYYPQGAYLTNLYLQTTNTVLQDKLVVKYPSLEALKTQMGLMQLQLQLKNSVVGMADVLIFAPQLRSQEIFKRYGNDKLKINTAIDGFVNALNIKQFQLAGFGGTYVDINGKLNGLPDADKLNYNLAIKRLQSQKATVMAFMPASVKQQIDLPNSFNITGRVSGNVKDYNTDLLATTTDGNAVIKGKILMSPGAGKERYDVIIKTENLNLGKILRKDSLMGRITANISAKGQSFDVKYMDAMLKGEIQSAGFMGYNYKAISFDAKVKDQLARANLVSNDPNAVLHLNADADMKGKYPALVAKLVIDSMDMQALKLSKEELRVRTTVNADIQELNPDYPRGVININRPQVVMSGTRYYLDSLYVSSQPNADSGNFIVMDADAIQAVITGKIPLSKVGTIIQQRIDKYYAPKKDSLKSIASKKAVDTTTIPASYNLNLSAIIRDRPLLHILMPGLKQLDTIKIDGALTPSDMYVNATMPKLQYNDMYLYNGKLNVQGRDSALTYDVTLDRFTQANYEFWYAKINGSLYDKKVDANVSIADSGKKERFALGAVYSMLDTQKISMKPGLVLNYKNWQVAQPNAIVFDTDGFYVQNFRISNGRESISINSETPQFSAPITAAINNFLISNITEIFSKNDTLLANGILNTNIKLQNPVKNPKATGTLTVTNLSVLNDTIGNLDVQLNEASATAINSRIAINGRGNDLAVTGYYYPTPVNGNNFDLNMQVNALNVQSMEGLAMHQIKNTSGYIRGNLKIQGTMAAPKVIGELRTDNLATTPVMLGAPLKFPEGSTIAFVSDGIAFRNFRIIDTLGNEGSISGKILTTNYRDMKLDLRLKTDRFQVMNSTPDNNKLFYGKMLLSSNLGIKGTPTAPVIDGNVTVHDSTKFTVVLPEDQATIQDREGIVEFVNMRDSGRTLAIRDTTPQIPVNSGIDMNLNVGIEKNAEFSVIIDQGTGDFLRVRGEASLNTTIRPDGTIGLTGIYELKDGAYELNYNLIKRKFKIQSGSTITFAGDPLDADVNITAVYDANIAPYDLVSKQVQEDQLVYYKQRLPFEVHLNMKGSLMKPQIGFDVVLPEDKPLTVSSDVSSLVQSKLSQIRTNASELNKQVFAVLILNRFVSDNPFESGAGGGGAEYVARQSASRFIGEQLNKFADQLVQGLELTFDLQSTEDYTTGTKRNRTDLNVAASKRLLNDRLTLTVGNNFELEGQNQNKNQTTSLIPGNLAADYQLSKDGRYMIRIYRRNEMEDILQGYVVETGTNFIVTLNYNKFRNIFRNRRQNRENRQRNREIQKMEADDRTTKGAAN